MNDTANDNDTNWEDQLQLTEKHKCKNSTYNVRLILTNHADWLGKIRYDEFEEKTKYNGANWEDHNTTDCKTWLSEFYVIEVSTSTIDSIVDAIARSNSYHPVREYLQSLTWDGRERLPNWLREICGADDSLYHSEIGRMWLVSAVARVMIPGCQADSALVLISQEQGVGKSTAFHVLGKSWTADSSIDIGTKDAMQALSGVWIYELAELSSVRSARDVETVKSFITTRCDHYRSPYGHRYADHPRQIAFGGTSNNTKCLHDNENRRFWPVEVSQIDIERLTNEVDQLWAEAYSRFTNGETWHPETEELKNLIREHGLDHTETDPWHDPIARLVEEYNMSDGITTEHILSTTIRLEVKDQTRAHEMRVSNVMKLLGYTNKRTMIDGRRCHRWFGQGIACPTRPKST